MQDFLLAIAPPTRNQYGSCIYNPGCAILLLSPAPASTPRIALASATTALRVKKLRPEPLRLDTSIGDLLRGIQNTLTKSRTRDLLSCEANFIPENLKITSVLNFSKQSPSQLCSLSYSGPKHHLLPSHFSLMQTSPTFSAHSPY